MSDVLLNTMVVVSCVLIVIVGAISIGIIWKR